jgi:phosphatidate cytidylyltransferase
MAAPRVSGGLATRVVVGVALAAVAIAAVWAGGVAFTALVATAVLLMSAEWSVMHGVSRGFRLASLVALAFVAGVTVYVSAIDALVVLAASAGVIGLFMRGFDRKRAFWVAAGLLYCGLPMVALLWLRGHENGLGIVAWTFAVVWTTDIAAFFVGRFIGGPKLAPSISPNKTIAGLLGGIVAAAGVAAVAGTLLGERFTQGRVPVALAFVGAGLAFNAQLGDLLESRIKRRAGVKDSGNLLPGHGGVMDRIDGLLPVCLLVAICVAFAPPGIWK